MLRASMLFILSFSSCIFTYAQIAKLSGFVQDAEGNMIISAQISLFNAADSTLAKLAVTNLDGRFEIQTLKLGTYYLKASYLGMEDKVIKPLEVNSDIDLGKITLTLSAVALDEMLVSAKRSLLEVKADRTIFNVEGTINSVGSDALNLLRKAPGVVVDNNNNLSLLGRNGVLVYVDGKRLNLSAQEISNYLENIQADQIDRFEIISSPGAKYEAEGNAGIIDIKLKKNVNHGTNGTVGVGYSQGRYDRYNVSSSANYRNAKVNLFGSVGAGSNDRFNHMYFESFQNDLFLLEKNDTKMDGYSINYKLGSDIFINKQHTLGFLFNGQLSQDDNLGENFIVIAPAENPTGVDSILEARSDINNERNNQTYNLNYSFQKSKKSSLNIDLDYGNFKNDASRNQPNIYFTPDTGTVLSRVDNSFVTPIKITIASFKADYEHKMGRSTLESGIKYGSVRTNNTFHFYDGLIDNRTLNTRNSNRFLYDENVFAAYVQYATPIKTNWNIQLGLRGEQTNATGELIAYQPELQEKPVVLNYFQLFPNAAILWRASENHQWNLNYGRRINRPDYNVLNPFNNQLSQLSFERGNPNLKPEIVNNLELAYTYKYRFNFKIAYSKTYNQITRLIGPDEFDPRASFINWDNLAEQTVFSFNASLPFTINKFWSVYSNANFAHTHNKADYGGNAIVDLRAVSYSAYQQHSFTLPLKLILEISGYFSGPGIWGGVFLYEPSGSLDIGVQRKFLNDKLNVRISGNDLLYSIGWDGISRFNGLDSEGRGRWDSRRLSINLNYSFGNQNIKSRKRKIGIEDETKRVNSN